MSKASPTSLRDKFAGFAKEASAKVNAAGKERGTEASEPPMAPAPTEATGTIDVGSALRTPLPAASGAAQQLALADVIDSPFQPRKRALTKKDVAELMSSLSAAGQVTPIVVSPSGTQPGKYVVHSGHRRCAALRFLGATTVAAVVREGMDDREARKIAVADNIGREDLSAFEQAQAIREYSDSFSLSYESAAQELGVQSRTAFRLKAILGASEAMQQIIREHALAAKPADLLVKLEGTNPRRARQLAERFVAGKANALDLERETRATKSPRTVAASSRDVEVEINERLVTLKVRVTRELVSDPQRERITEAVARMLGAIGIERVEAAAQG